MLSQWSYFPFKACLVSSSKRTYISINFWQILWPLSFLLWIYLFEICKLLLVEIFLSRCIFNIMKTLNTYLRKWQSYIFIWITMVILGKCWYVKINAFKKNFQNHISNFVVSKNSNTLVNKRSGNVHLCQVPDFMRKILNLSLLNRKLAFS